MFAFTEDESVKNLVVVAFRGSGKSTIMTLSYPIWAILGKQQKKFVVILGQTQRQARQHLVNLKQELERNKLLRTDLGPFKEQEDEWGSYSLVIPRYGARITAASSEQSIRGLRHGPYRPDLIIADDVEDLTSVKTREGRDKIHQWFTGDVIPAGDKNTRIVVVGNLLHEDSLIMRLCASITEGKFDGAFKDYPLLDESGRCLWPGKFPTKEAVEAIKRSIGNESAWQREYLLRIIADEGQLITREQIHYYDRLPPLKDNEHFWFSATGIDLAISESTTADYTAMVSAHVFGKSREDKVIYIAPNPINRRLNFAQTVETAKHISHSLGNGTMTKLYVEDVAYQAAAVQEMERQGLPAEGVKVHGTDKRARLSVISHLIQNGKILFPRKGAEALIEQIVHFGVERHDDLVDAFTMLILQMTAERRMAQPEVFVLKSRPLRLGRRSSFWDDDND
ncbi:hypothetical protein A2753_02815 [Candidatus Uhrbacteria bacterium RIFCSPHIGHO2_01_FULL_47_11]|nr:MAG: hypothetical protein A2753_02815 [Candidatus Uhrbacteria bacterium RIFCSPHIGHO2_01_FULL_47_11]